MMAQPHHQAPPSSYSYGNRSYDTQTSDTENPNKAMQWEKATKEIVQQMATLGLQVKVKQADRTISGG